MQKLVNSKQKKIKIIIILKTIGVEEMLQLLRSLVAHAKEMLHVDEYTDYLK